MQQEVPTVPNGMRWVGLGVHAGQTACAVVATQADEVLTRQIVGRPHEVLDWLRALEAPVRAVYEAGPTATGVARRVRAADGLCAVICDFERFPRANSVTAYLARSQREHPAARVSRPPWNCGAAVRTVNLSQAEQAATSGAVVVVVV